MCQCLILAEQCDEQPVRACVLGHAVAVCHVQRGGAEGMEELTHRLPTSVTTKMTEMMFEAIPGCVMQLYVIFSMLAEGRNVSKLAYLSLLVSALSTGYSVSVRGRHEREGCARWALA